MKDCPQKSLILEYCENLLSLQARSLFEKHLKECSQCKQELEALKKLYELMKHDEVVMPEPEFFERLKANLSKKEIYLRKPIGRILGLLAPVLSLIIFFILFSPEKERIIEISISSLSLTQDEDLNSLLLERIVDDELVDKFKQLEDYINGESIQILQDLNPTEKKEFIEILIQKYGKEYL
ncbi:MAG: hypothetical protein ABIL39_08810 [candidate division WOR-3 bacterium]